jgi:hypothetical protein
VIAGGQWDAEFAGQAEPGPIDGKDLGAYLDQHEGQQLRPGDTSVPFRHLDHELFTKAHDPELPH